MVNNVSVGDMTNHESSRAVSLPEVENPPVGETFLSVSFADLDRWSVPHFVLYSSSIRSEYPKFELRPPLGMEMERFGDPRQPSQVVQLLVNQPPVPAWAIHLIQH